MLAVIAPTVDPVEHPAEAGALPPVVLPVVAPAQPPSLGNASDAPAGPEMFVLARRLPAGPPASRAGSRRSTIRALAGPAGHSTGRASSVRWAARRAAVSQAAKLAAVPRAARPRPVPRVSATARPYARGHRRAVHPTGRRYRLGNHRTGRSPGVSHRRVAARATGRPARGMAAVIAYARAQVGKQYRSGGAGPGSFDCSGFTMRAYARAGYRLPHSSVAQAARAHPVSRSQARAGDLVVGPGHVGIYMGGGMMIDAGNSRVGVVYRAMYAGLHTERF